MSRVFLAREVRLGRDVVVKVLSPELAEGVSAERFERELRTVARLQHPNIVPLLTAGSTDGLPYYTMPFIRGESLRARLNAGALTSRSAMRFLGDVAHALAHAHAQGVVHRDIKPENVLIADGIAVVTDFGISKALDMARSRQAADTLTQFGMALGTPAYMAPEQAAGDPDTDLRADLYAWAVLAYECLTGAHPFAGKRSGHEYVAAHMIERPVPITERRPSISTMLATLVMQCLEKDRDARPESARVLVDALESTMAAADIGKAADSRAVADQLSVRTLLEGSVRRVGNRVRITTQLVNAADGFQLWSDRFDRELTDIFAVQDEIANSIAATLRSTLLDGRPVEGATPNDDSQPDRQLPRRTRPSTNVEAYDAYLKGRYLNHRRGEGHSEAITHFQRALALDPAFAPALAGLAEANLWLAIAMTLPPTEAFAQARRYAQKALALDPDLAHAHYILGEIAFWHEWDADAAERHVQRALALDARSAETLQLRARFHVLRGRPEHAVADSDAAVEADPVGLGTRWYAVVIAYLIGSYRDAIAAADRLIAQEPRYADAFRWRGRSRCMIGDVEGGLVDLKAAATLGNVLPWLPAETAVAFCLTGHAAEARAIRDELVQRSNHGWIPPSAMALVEQALGDYDAAFRWLERAYETRDFLCVVLPFEGYCRFVAPGHDRAIVDDPRWDEFVRRVGMVGERSV